MPDSEAVPDLHAEAHAVEATTAAHGATAAHDAHAEVPGKAQYVFMDVLMHHIRPSHALEYVHGHPILIFNLERYSANNFAHLSHDPAFVQADPAANLAWATASAAKPGYQGVPAEQLAKAMTVASEMPVLGTFPQSLSWLNQQTFFGTFALLLMASVLLIFARRKPEQLKPANRVQHVIEATTLFIRDDIVRPNMGDHADGWVPHFTALFLAILAFNLIGLAPVFSAASGNPGVTTAFALTTFVTMLLFGFKEQGFVHFWINLVPVKWSWKPMDMVIWLMLAPIELIGLFIKPAALAIRLFANMFAGHAVLISFSSLGFVLLASNPENPAMALGMGGFGWLLTIALYFLELLVALLQAYVFTILSAVFIGQSMHPEH